MNGHPGMHALSEMKKYSSQKQSSDGKGILGVVLPLYAFGIVVYLIYTLSRVRTFQTLIFHKYTNKFQNYFPNINHCLTMPYCQGQMSTEI